MFRRTDTNRSQWVWYCQGPREWIVTDVDPADHEDGRDCVRGIASAVTHATHPVDVLTWRYWHADLNAWRTSASSRFGGVVFACAPLDEEQTCDAVAFANPVPLPQGIPAGPFLRMGSGTWAGRPVYATEDAMFFLFFCSAHAEWIIAPHAPPAWFHSRAAEEALAAGLSLSRLEGNETTEINLRNKVARPRGSDTSPDFSEEVCVPQVVSRSTSSASLPTSNGLTWAFINASSDEWHTAPPSMRMVCVAHCQTVTIVPFDEASSGIAGAYTAMGVRLNGSVVYRRHNQPPHFLLRSTTAFRLPSWVVTSSTALGSLTSTDVRAVAADAPHPLAASRWRARSHPDADFAPLNMLVQCSNHEQCSVVHVRITVTPNTTASAGSSASGGPAKVRDAIVHRDRSLLEGEYHIEPAGLAARPVFIQRLQGDTGHPTMSPAWTPTKSTIRHVIAFHDSSGRWVIVRASPLKSTDWLLKATTGARGWTTLPSSAGLSWSMMKHGMPLAEFVRRVPATVTPSADVLRDIYDNSTSIQVYCVATADQPHNGGATGGTSSDPPKGEGAATGGEGGSTSAGESSPLSSAGGDRHQERAASSVATQSSASRGPAVITDVYQDSITDSSFVANSVLGEASTTAVAGAVLIRFAATPLGLDHNVRIHKCNFLRNEATDSAPAVASRHVTQLRSVGGVAIVHRQRRRHRHPITDSLFMHNVGATGGLLVEGVFAMLRHTTFRFNTAAVRGGGLSVINSNASFVGGQCYANHAMLDGGCAVVDTTSRVGFSRTDIAMNTAGRDGSAIASGSFITVTDSKVDRMADFAVSSVYLSLSQSELSCSRGAAVAFVGGFGCMPDASLDGVPTLPASTAGTTLGVLALPTADAVADAATGDVPQRLQTASSTGDSGSSVAPTTAASVPPGYTTEPFAFDTTGVTIDYVNSLIIWANYASLVAQGMLTTTMLLFAIQHAVPYIHRYGWLPPVPSPPVRVAVVGGRS